MSGLEKIDNLAYQYTGNRLTSVSDSSGNYNGYPEVSGNTIAYDNNGNMIDQKDKGILNITYNYLNLPNQTTFNSTYIPRSQDVNNYVKTRYLYKADGTKLKKTYSFAATRTRLEMIKITEYLDGFQYEKSFRWGVVDPLAEKHFELNPMMYAANNPIMFIGPDGRDWNITETYDKKQILPIWKNSTTDR